MNHAPDSRPVTLVSIRKYAPADASAMSALAKLAPESAQWSPESYQQGAEAGQTILVAEEGGEICGFLVSRWVASEGEILNMAVAPVSRRKGVASQLLGDALEEARRRHVERIYLEVRESNGAAILFYETHGFARSGRRANYYSNPTEDAVLMERKLTG
jgi:ribosomal-protein-alanine N-acetyltransferase